MPYFGALAATLLLGPVQPLPLSFDGLLQEQGGRLVPGAKLIAAVGKRVRMRGFMANLEVLPKGGFWLCGVPVQGDESGGGTADLPPQSVFVVVRTAPGRPIAPLRRAVEVTGVLEMGPKTLTDGTFTQLRLILDRPAPKPLSQPTSKSVRKPVGPSASH